MAVPTPAVDAEYIPWWHITVFVRGIGGRLIAYFALRGNAPRMSKHCLLRELSERS